jgi:hypothetical protein
MCSQRGTTFGFKYAPLPGRQLAKLFWRTCPPDGNDIEWLRGVVAGSIRDYAHVPVLRAVIWRLSYILCVKPGAYVTSLAHERPHARNASFATNDTFDQFCLIYGCSPDDIHDAEEEAIKMEHVNHIFQHWLFNHMAEVDVLAPLSPAAGYFQ